jgi:hypothetical protein
MKKISFETYLIMQATLGDRIPPSLRKEEVDRILDFNEASVILSTPKPAEVQGEKTKLKRNAPRVTKNT